MRSGRDGGRKAWAERRLGGTKGHYADSCCEDWLLSQGLTVACTFDRKHFSRLPGVEVRVPGEIHRGSYIP